MGVATAGFGALGGIAKFFEGRSQQRRAQTLIDDFQHQELENPYEDIQLSTVGTEMQLEQANQMYANSVDAMRTAGARGIAQIGKAQGQHDKVTDNIVNNLESQDMNRQVNIAKGNEMIQQIKEGRNQQTLQGYGQMLNVGQQMKYSGVGDLLNTAGYISQLGGGAADALGTDVGTTASGNGVTTQNSNYVGTSNGVTPGGFGSLGSGVTGNATTDYLAKLGIL